MSGDLNHLAEVYERDPATYTKEDYDLIIVEQRKAFAAFSAGAKDAGTSKTKKKAVDPAKVAAANAMLKDLGLL